MEKEIELLSVENPDWELRHYEDRGSYVGPKHIGDMIELMLEEEL